MLSLVKVQEVWDLCKDVTERSSSIRNNFYAVKFLYRINSFTEANYSITLSVLSPIISRFPVLNTGRRFSRAFFIDCTLCLSNYIRSSGQLCLLLRHSKQTLEKNTVRKVVTTNDSTYHRRLCCSLRSADLPRTKPPSCDIHSSIPFHHYHTLDLFWRSSYSPRDTDKWADC